MPRLIELDAHGAAAWADDPFTVIADEDPVPAEGDVIVSLQRFIGEADALAGDRGVGVILQAGEAVEDLAYDLPRTAVVALTFPKFRDGRALSAARLLRERLGYRGQVRAVGDVLQELALHMVRCGFDAFEPADGAGPDVWAAAAHRYRHVYQRAADRRPPAYAERLAAGQDYSEADHGL